jgi:methyl-accepting chemotaxis protein
MSVGKSLNLRMRMMIVIVSAVLAGFLISVSLLTWQASRAQQSVAILYAEQLAQSNANQVRARLESTLGTARTLVQTLTGMRAAGNPERKSADAILKSVMEGHPGYLGVWTTWEPNAFDGQDARFVNAPGTDATGRYLPYWNRGSGTVALESAVNATSSTESSDWYQIPKRHGKETLMEPYRDTVGGQEVLMTSLAVPMSIDGKFVGVTGIDIALSELQSDIARIHPYGSGYASLISNTGQYVGDRDAANVGKPIAQAGASADEQAAVREGRRFVSTADGGALGPVTRVFVPIQIGDTGTTWSFAVTVPDREVMAEVTKLRYTAAAMGLLSVIAVSLGLSVALNRLVLRPLGGEPADAVDLAQRVAEGDLSVRIAVKHGDTTSLMAALHRMQERLSSVVAGVRHNASGVASASAEIAQGNMDLSGRTEQQAAALEETAASMDEFSSTVRQNAENAREANQLAAVASDVARQGGTVVGEVVATMRDISDSSSQITDIISVIEAIAFQTNILALNAAVEAARAGEQGRGFAVVASEVRNLAQRSATAAKEIKDLIGVSVERVERGTTLVDQAGATMTEVVTAIRRVASIMGEISTASDEQNKGVVQIGEAVNQMDQSTQQNAALVEQSAAAAHSLREQADELVRAVGIFRLRD